MECPFYVWPQLWWKFIIYTYSDQNTQKRLTYHLKLIIIMLTFIILIIKAENHIEVVYICKRNV